MQDTISENLAHFLNKVYVKIDVKNQISEEEYRAKLNEKFGLDIHFEYEVIESCYWLIEDTELAIKDFEEFGLQGPTRIKNNIGEEYLRLYGFLNAINLQKSILVQLYEIFKLPNKKEIINRLKEIELIKLRNKIASHSVDYIENGIRDFFRISRPTLEHQYDGLHIIGKKGLDKFNLTKLLVEFKEVFNAELYNICIYLLKKFFIEKSNNYKELKEILYLIQQRISGNIVMQHPFEDSFTIITSDINVIKKEN